LYTYLGVIAFFVLWSMSGSFTNDLESRWIGALVDPSGGAAVAEHIRYWSSAQYNTRLPGLTGLLLANRALWLGISLVMLAAAFSLFRADREGIVLRRRRVAAETDAAAAEDAGAASALPQVALRSDWRAQWRQYLHQSWFDLRNTLRGAPFIVMVVLGLLLTFTVIKFSGLIYGTRTLPVTAQMLDMIGGGM